MRAIYLLAVLGVLAATGCTSETVEQDTAYRRLGDAFTSEEQCLAGGNFNPCYQTLTLCTSGRITMDLANRPTEGEYRLDGEAAVAQFTDMHVVFDLEARSSAQLPGVHPWVVVEPIVYDCLE